MAVADTAARRAGRSGLGCRPHLGKALASASLEHAVQGRANEGTGTYVAVVSGTHAEQPEEAAEGEEGEEGQSMPPASELGRRAKEGIECKRWSDRQHFHTLSVLEKGHQAHAKGRLWRRLFIWHRGGARGQTSTIM